MEATQQEKNRRQIAIWLLIGVGMIVVQVLIGGITRLTESGLSITEWKPLTGALPPLNDAAWQTEFEKYKVTDQFKYVHQHFSLKEFKFIFFWEWFHRSWARLMGLVFLFGFSYFLVKKKFNKEMIRPMIILFLLGGVQGFIGWVMVKSGLVPEKYFVGHVELTTHFIAALGLLSYTLWFALSLMVKQKQKLVHAGLNNFLLAILAVFIVQLIYGGFMAGLRAAISAPTWPDINGAMIPAGVFGEPGFVQNLLSNPIAVHLVHRSIAYLLVILIGLWWWRSKAAVQNNLLFSRLRFVLFSGVLLQVLLGIITVLNATLPNSLVLAGVAHQFVAMILLMVMVSLLFVVRRKAVR